MQIDPLIAIAVSWFLAGIFVLAAFHKLANQVQFNTTLRGYGLVPEAAISSVRRGLAVTELASAALLTAGTGVLVPIGALAAAFLLALYAAVMTSALLRNRADIDCGCHFGAAPSEGAASGSITWMLVIRNAVLVTLAGALLLPLSRPEHWLDILGGVAAAGLCWLLLQSAGHANLNQKKIRASARRVSR